MWFPQLLNSNCVFSLQTLIKIALKINLNILCAKSLVGFMLIIHQLEVFLIYNTVEADL